MENWKDVPNYEGLYQVSDLGRVKALANEAKVTHRDEHLLSQSNHKGYRNVALCKDGKMKTFQVHRLVALAFLDNPQGKPEIDHINTIRSDNRLVNLRWVTCKENNSNALTKIHKSESKKGNKNPNYGTGANEYLKAYSQAMRVKVIQKDMFGNILGVFESIKDAGLRTGINETNISRASRGKRNTAGGCLWETVTR